MGHITNPVGFRVGRVTTWSSNWSSDKYTYANNWVIDISFQRYFKYLFKKLNYLSYKSGFILSHVRILMLSNFYVVNIYLYNSNVMLFYKGRFFYYWRRIRVIREGKILRPALVTSFVKKSMLTLFMSGFSQKRTFNYKIDFLQKRLAFYKYAKKNPFFFVMRRLLYFKKPNKGILYGPVIPYFLLRNSSVYKRSLLFKKRRYNALFANKYFIFNKRSVTAF